MTMFYDKTLKATTYFRPEIKNIINTVFIRKFEELTILQALLDIPLVYFGSWSFSFIVLVILYSIMFGIGITGLYIPVELLCILFVVLVLVMRKCTLLSSLTFGTGLSLLIAITHSTFSFIIPMVLFLILRFVVDIGPAIELLLFKDMYDTIGFIYIYGYAEPLENRDSLKNTIKKLLHKYKTPERYIMSAYALGHFYSDDKEIEPMKVTEFIVNVIKECSI